MTTERRLHVGSLPAGGGRLELTGDAAEHGRVLRLAAGDEVVLFDGEGQLALATVERFDGRRLVLAVGEPTRAAPDPVAVTLVLALPRAGKLDDVVRGATELGVTRVVLAHAARSQVRGDTASRRDRLDAIVREACRQSERAFAPRIEGPFDLARAVSLVSDSPNRLTACGRTGSALGALSGGAASVVVGPEGGLTEEELALLDGHGFRRVSLGPYVLRVETAALAAVAVVRQALST